MSPNEMYKNILRNQKTKSMSQGEFVAFYNATLSDLSSQYDEKYVFDNAFLPITNIEETNSLKSCYDNAVLNNIIFLYTGEEVYKQLYFSDNTAGYLSTWRKISKNKKMKARSFDV